MLGLGRRFEIAGPSRSLVTLGLRAVAAWQVVAGWTPVGVGDLVLTPARVLPERASGLVVF